MCVVSEPRKEKQYRNHKSLIQTVLVSNCVSEKHLRIWFSMNICFSHHIEEKKETLILPRRCNTWTNSLIWKVSDNGILTTQNIIIWMVRFLLDFFKWNFHWDDSFLHRNKSAPVGISDHKICHSNISIASKRHNWMMKIFTRLTLVKLPLDKIRSKNTDNNNIYY